MYLRGYWADCGFANVDVLAIRPGDFDLDGDVDGVDLGMFSACFNGTGNVVTGACKRRSKNVAPGRVPTVGSRT